MSADSRYMDKRSAYEHILYELCRHNIGKHKDMRSAQAKIDMIMKVMSARRAIGREWSAAISDDGKTVDLKWSGVGAGDAAQEHEIDFDFLIFENADAVATIAVVSTT